MSMPERCRLYGKQPAPANYHVKKTCAKRTPSKKEPMKRPSKANGRKTRKTELRIAIEAGLVPKAAKPFAIFCRETSQKGSVASVAWTALSANEKQKYVDMSEAEFALQRKKSMEAGVNLRLRQVKSTDLAEAVTAQVVRKGQNPFAVYLSDMKQAPKQASGQWEKMSKQEKNKYVEKSKASFALAHQSQQALNIQNPRSKFLKTFGVKGCEASSHTCADEVHVDTW